MSQNQNNQAVNLAKCSKGNQALMVCFSQHCNNKAFICKDENCQCLSSHNQCLKLGIKNLQKTILANSYSLQPLEKDISTVFEKAIKYLEDQKERVLKEIQEKFHYLGLNKLEKKFIEVVKKGTNDAQINCQFVSNIYLGLKGQNKMKQSLDEISKEIKKIEQDFDVQIKKFSINFTKMLQQVKQREEEIFLKSKIVKTIEDQNKLLAFFTEKKVDSAQMLYRASQNEFLVSKWHEKCDHIPHTLTIVETEFGKVIGGFTSFSWFKAKTAHWVSSANNQVDHFIFSLTNNDKFLLTQNPANCIYLMNNDTYGPKFGECDLYIYDKANQNSSSGANIGHTYTNANYKVNDAPSYVKFAGAQSFKIKQWQVWKINLK